MTRVCVCVVVCLCVIQLWTELWGLKENNRCPKQPCGNNAGIMHGNIHRSDSNGLMQWITAHLQIRRYLSWSDYITSTETSHTAARCGCSVVLKKGLNLPMRCLCYRSVQHGAGGRDCGPSWRLWSAPPPAGSGSGPSWRPPSPPSGLPPAPWLARLSTGDVSPVSEAHSEGLHCHAPAATHTHTHTTTTCTVLMGFLRSLWSEVRHIMWPSSGIRADFQTAFLIN